MTKATRILLGLCALAVSAIVAAGCGGVPGNAVAQVDGTSIAKSSFDHWMTVALKSSAQSGGAQPDPPKYDKCVAALRKQTPKPAKGQPKVTDDQLRTQCKQQYTQAREQVLNLLVSWQWIEKEAKDRDIKVTDAEVKKSFDEQRKQNFPKDADYQKFLKDSGRTQDDVMEQIRQDLLGQKLQKEIVKGKDKVTPQQVQAFYDKNKSRFSQPERRDLRIVLTKDEAKANDAKKALEDGDSWKAVAKQYSIDQASKSQGGELKQQAKGTLEQALDKAVFAAKKGQLTGPVKTPFGYYVFEVEKVQAAETQTLEQAKPTIEQTLKSQNQQKALNDFLEDFRKKWKDKTDCRDGYKIELCKGEKAKATPTPTPGATG